MPRRFNYSGGLVYHVLNRAVRRVPLFDGPGDYCACMTILAEACQRVPMRVLALALMPNHWHLVLWPREDDDLSQFVGWATLTHALRWHRVKQTRGTGPVYQARFQAIPVQDDAHLLTVCRYVERNPVRAGLVARAQDWPFSSAADTYDSDWPPVQPWPVPRPSNWLDLVNAPEPGTTLETLRAAISRRQPYGSNEWKRRMSPGAERE